LADGSASGFVFHDMTAQGFADALKRTAAAYGNPRIWRRLKKNGMLKDFSWRASAKSYRKLYLSLLP
jgi:starch synthase